MRTGPEDDDDSSDMIALAGPPSEGSFNSVAKLQEDGSEDLVVLRKDLAGVRADRSAEDLRNPRLPDRSTSPLAKRLKRMISARTVAMRDPAFTAALLDTETQPGKKGNAFTVTREKAVQDRLPLPDMRGKGHVGTAEFPELQDQAAALSRSRADSTIPSILASAFPSRPAMIHLLTGHNFSNCRPLPTQRCRPWTRPPGHRNRRKNPQQNLSAQKI